MRARTEVLPPETRPLLDREHELQALADALAAGGAIVAIEGEAGIGKTTLVEAATALADGRTVLRAAGGELEREFGFGIVRALFERAVREDRTLLQGAAGHAAAALGLEGGGGDRFATLHGLYWLVAGLAERGPLLLAVDDAHWADDDSLGALTYIARRLEELPVTIVIATRGGRALQDRRVLAAMVADRRTRVLRPAPLGRAGVAEVAQDVLGSEPDEAFVAAVTEATGGNPFLVVELLRDGGDVSGRTPDTIVRSLLLRLDALGPEARRLAEAVAVLGGGARAGDLAGLPDGTDALDALIDAAILTPDLAFAHPIARQAVYEAIPPAARSTAHERAARLLHDCGEPADAVAAHLLAAPARGSEWTVTRLTEAAGAAMTRGAPGEAVAMLRRALNEPPPAGDRPALLAQLAGAEAMAGDPAAPARYRDALAAETDPHRRAALGLTLGRLLLFSGDASGALAALLDASAEIGAIEPGAGASDQRRETRLQLAAELLAVERVDPAARAARPAGVVPDPDALSGATPGERAVLAGLALARLMAAAPPDAAVAIARRALSDEDGLASPTSLNAVTVLMLADELDAVDAWLERAAAQARERGDIAGHIATVTFRSHAAFRRGALAEALADAREAIAQARAHGLDVLACLGIAFLLDAALETGAFDEAEASLTGLDGELPDHFHLNAVLARRGRLRAAQGRTDEAAADLLEVGARQQRAGIENPTFGSWRSDAALVLGRGDLAAEELELARAVGQPRAIAIALRAAVRLAGPAGATEIEPTHETAATGALALTREAAAAAAASPDRLLQAHALADVGAALRAAGQRKEAREPLRRALDLAARRGAEPLAAGVRDELLAAGARPRSPHLTGVEALTPGELRCARMAAAGMSNREIAQALFVTVRAVEMHLTAAYRTLGISSRRDLPEALQ